MTGDEGYTLTELMVALIAGSLVVSFVFSLFTFSQRVTTAWQRKVEVRLLTEMAVGVIAEDIGRAKSIIDLNDSVAVIEQDLHKTVVYRFGPTMVFRNDDPLCLQKGVSLSVTMVKNDDRYVINANARYGSLGYEIGRTALPKQSGRQQFISGLTDGSSR